MMKNVFLAGIAGAIVLFIWSSISWMVLSWHEKTLHEFKNETTVVTILKENIDKSGVYFSNQTTKNHAAGTGNNMPAVFASVSLEPTAGMSRALVISFVMQLVTAWLVAYMLAKTAITCHYGRVFFVVIFAVAAAIIGNLPYWNWWGFEINYTLVTIVDMIIGWFLAGLAIAALVKCRPCSAEKTTAQ